MMDHPIEKYQVYRDVTGNYVGGLRVRKIWIDEDGNPQIRVNEGDLDKKFGRFYLSNAESTSVDVGTFIDRVESGELEVVN